MKIDGTWEWYVGEVLRISNAYWADVNYSDGKLWMKVKPSERDVTWHVVEQNTACRRAE